ncbi:MAG: hypothetical protein ACREQJ_15495, partial [Candidatus Binatia bacterium]
MPIRIEARGAAEGALTIDLADSELVQARADLAREVTGAFGAKRLQQLPQSEPDPARGLTLILVGHIVARDRRDHAAADRIGVEELSYLALCFAAVAERGALRLADVVGDVTNPACE